MYDPLLAISPIDGRYHQKTSCLQDTFSEFGLIKTRLFVEIKWLIFLCNDLKLPKTRKISPEQVSKLLSIHSYFDVAGAQEVKKIESETNHDVKAVEYYLKSKLKEIDLNDLSEFVHFGCTSEDINNTSYSLILQQGSNQGIIPQVEELLKTIEKLAKDNKDLVMMGRTHGQPASPTTLGKELVNFAERIRQQLGKIKEFEFSGKFNGATGNFNAHSITYAKIDWLKASAKFLKELGLKPQMLTTQIEPHDHFAELFHTYIRLNNIIIDFATDTWSYISLNYFKQTTKAGEVGSSTMPHKVNPIDFENAEGNLELANALLTFLADKLAKSRLQRDLSDSTVQRNMGLALSYSFLGYTSCLKGLSKVAINKEAIANDLSQNWAIIGEALQSIMRREGVDQPYEKLKALTRGKEVNEKTIKKFIDQLKLDKTTTKAMAKITPHNYSGLASKLVELYFKQK